MTADTPDPTPGKRPRRDYTPQLRATLRFLFVVALLAAFGRWAWYQPFMAKPRAIAGNFMIVDGEPNVRPGALRRDDLADIFCWRDMTRAGFFVPDVDRSDTVVDQIVLVVVPHALPAVEKRAHGSCRHLLHSALPQ